jgi:arylsulfatase A-like enzyme
MSERAAYLLIDHITDATKTGAAPPPTVSFIELGHDQRRALLQPPSTYRFARVPTGHGAVFSTASALQTFQKSAADGVGIELRCATAKGGWHSLFRRSLKAHGRGKPQLWEEIEIKLSACSSPTTNLELRTICAEGRDCRDHVVAWANPRVLHARRFEPRFTRLVVLISIDTLRPDHLSVYGYDRSTSPHLEALAEDAVVFDVAVAPAPWTIPSHASLLTSASPRIHGATSQHDIRAGLPLLSEILDATGWTTAGFVDTPWLGQFGFTRGYDHYDAEAPPPGSFRRGAQATRERLEDWLLQAEGDVFVFWHLMDVHGPYGAPAPFGGRFRSGVSHVTGSAFPELRKLEYHNYLELGRFRSFEDLVASYDEGIANVDSEVGQFLDLLRTSGFYDEALIVVTSDHGESLLDHGVWVGHGLFLTDDEIRVPLLIKLPDNRFAGRRIGAMVRLLDVAPTMLDVLEVTIPPSFEGVSLVSPHPGAPTAVPRLAYGESSNNGSRYVRSNGSKLITDWTSHREGVLSNHLRVKKPTPLTQNLEDKEQLYDLSSDPEELHNLIDANEWKKTAADLRLLLQRHQQALEHLDRSLHEAATERPSVMSEEQVQQLKALGYLGGVDR